MKEGIGLNVQLSLTLQAVEENGKKIGMLFAHSEYQLPFLSGPAKLGILPSQKTPHNYIYLPVDDCYSKSKIGTRVGAGVFLGGDTSNVRCSQESIPEALC